jgi:hypothetical protein
VRFIVASRLGWGLAVPGGGDLGLVDVAGTSRPPRSFEVREVLATSVHEVVAKDHADAVAILRRETRANRALECFISGMDTTLPVSVRFAAVAALRSLLSGDESVLAELARVTLSVPLPAKSPVECDVAGQLSETLASPEAAALYRALGANLERLQALQESLTRALSGERFGALRELFLAAITESRIVGDLISRRTEDLTVEHLSERLAEALDRMGVHLADRSVVDDAARKVFRLLERFVAQSTREGLDARRESVTAPIKPESRQTVREIPTAYGSGGGGLGLAVDVDVRAHARLFELTAHADFTGNEVVDYHRVQNISLGGVCIQSSGVEDVGTEIDLIINFPDLGESIAVKGEVVWKNLDPPMDMGVRYLNLDDQARATLRRYLAMARRS